MDYNELWTAARRRRPPGSISRLRGFRRQRELASVAFNSASAFFCRPWALFLPFLLFHLALVFRFFFFKSPASRGRLPPDNPELVNAASMASRHVEGRRVHLSLRSLSFRGSERRIPVASADVGLEFLPADPRLPVWKSTSVGCTDNSSPSHLA